MAKLKAELKVMAFDARLGKEVKIAGFTALEPGAVYPFCRTVGR